MALHVKSAEIAPIVYAHVNDKLMIGSQPQIVRLVWIRILLLTKSPKI
jgi:hypothetical protein